MVRSKDLASCVNNPLYENSYAQEPLRQPSETGHPFYYIKKSEMKSSKSHRDLIEEFCPIVKGHVTELQVTYLIRERLLST